MSDAQRRPRGGSHADADNNSSNNPSFSGVIQARISRRQMLEDEVRMPPRYSDDTLYALGDPIARKVPDFRNDGTDDAASFAHRAGDHHDAIQYFGLGRNGRRDPSSSDRGLLCMNHEAITPAFVYPNGQTIVDGVRTVPEEVLREFNVHGVSVLEVVKEKQRKRSSWSSAHSFFNHHHRRATSWDYEQDSRFNRCIHTLTEMKLSGPAARTQYMVTKYSPDGSKTRGTVNNCAHGTTPWGTYLTCEESWAGYFRRIAATDAPNRTTKELTSFGRYGVTGAGRELWATVTPDTPDNLYGRWNAMKLGTSADGSDDYRNVANTYGWVVEIDPYNPNSTPRKRTALGRMGHEGAWLGPVKAGEPLVWYMGDDGRNEYIYKYVSNEPWDPRDTDEGLAAGDRYLDNGKLFVAQFLPDGSGQWAELKFGINNITRSNPAYAFSDQADVLINARLAADAAGATKMDRPEWGAVHPRTGEVYFTLTDTTAASRPIEAVSPSNPRFYNDQTTTGTDQKGDPNGHIIRFAEEGGHGDALSFTWDVFLFGARTSADLETVNLSRLSGASDFSSPDGLFFSRANPGLLWTQADDGACTDVTHCMITGEVDAGRCNGRATSHPRCRCGPRS